ncbi:MAG: hypothetical protein CME13_06210 [Gemmatimonadetes bacterium]|nr:hypothetical protein [Gemmatimonadota bacterium]
MPGSRNTSAFTASGINSRREHWKPGSRRFIFRRSGDGSHLSCCRGTGKCEFQKVADFVDNFAPSRLIIEGHTDSDGETDANQELSMARAEAVRQYLIDRYDFISPAMVEARGYGEVRPAVPNNSPENKTLNRRIEVIVWE